ncbi:uncharacterized protein LOC117325106 [Pecten maximus]|uniref:uncharacterized protein LOC117325106 n=1 Tax=Pecten maximus TaxID=6579 RepID=UPI00145854FC|nr:uncharacterized protein LOC117325106 [Pecten maximus]
MDSNYDELDEEIGSLQNRLTDQTCPSKFTMPANPSRVKVSVPCAPVVLVDSSQNSTVEPVQAIAMKYMQSFQAQGMGNTSEPEEGMCADDNLESASLSDEQHSPVLSKVSEPVSCVNLGIQKSLKTANPKSAGISTPKTPTIQGQAKVKVKTPVVVLTPNEGTKSKKTLKKKLATVKTSAKYSEYRENLAMKAVPGKEKKLVFTSDSCQGKVDSMKVSAKHGTNINCEANIVQKKQTL